MQDRPPPQLDWPQSPTLTRHAVLAALCAAATIAYLQRACVATAEKDILKDIPLTDVQLGLVMSSFFWAYAAFQIPSGWLGDVWGARRSLASYSALWSLPTALMALAGGFPALFAAQFARGAGQAGIFPSSATIIRQWCPARSKAIATGLLASAQQVGAIIAMVLTPALLQTVGWRWTLACYAFPGLLWSVWFFAWFRNRPEEHADVNDAELELIAAGNPARDLIPRAGEAQSSTPWLKLLCSPSLWYVCLQQFFRGAGYIFFLTWFPRYLQEAHSVTLQKSGFMTAAPIVAVMCGGLAGGFVSDLVLSATHNLRLARQGVAIVGLFLCAALIGSTFFVHDAALSVAIISAGSFCAGLAGPSGYTVTIEMSGRHTGTIFGTMNMSGNIGAAIFPAVVPWLKDEFGWNWVIAVFAAIYLASAVCWLLINPRGTFAEQSLLRDG